MHTAGVGPLPSRLLSFQKAGEELVPAWFSDRDRPWLRDLLAEVDAANGTSVAQLTRRLRAADGDPRAGRRGPIARHVALALLRRQGTVASRAVLRRDLFRAAAGTPRDAAVRQVAAAHGLDADELLARLFADLPHARLVQPCRPPLEPSRLGLLCNLALVQGLLLHARRAQLWLRGASRAVLRTAWLHATGLDVDAIAGDRVRLRWQAGDRRRARALAALVPLLPWAQRYELRAHCRVQGETGTLVLATGDPILPGPEPRLFDSALEQRFMRDFAAAAPDWFLLREPAPIRLSDGLAFPDFALRRAGDDRVWLLEIAGLRDRSALPAKLQLLAHPRCIVGLPRRLVPPEHRLHPRIVPFDRHVTPTAVIAAALAQGGG